MQKPWYKTRYIRVSIESHIGEDVPGFYSNLNVNELVKKVVDSGAEVVMIHCCNGWGDLFYNTRVGHKCAALGKRDVVAEEIKEFHRRDIKVIGYFCTTGYDFHSYNEHPDWRQICADGTPAGEIFWRGVCHNSPYKNYLLEELTELVTNYDLDGLWLDNPWRVGGYGEKLVCYCKYCKEKFKKKFGVNPPTEPDWNSKLWRDFIQWRYDVIYDFLKECRETVKAIKPQIVFCFNMGDISLRSLTFKEAPVTAIYSDWIPGFSLVRNAELADYACHDLLFPKDGTLGRSMYLRFFRHLGREHPAEPWFSRSPSPGSWNIAQTKSLAHMRTEASLTLANGHAVLFGDQFTPEGTVYNLVWEKLSKVFSEIKSKEEWIIDSEPVNFAAVAFSQNSRDFYGKDNSSHYTQNFYGVCKCLLETHIPFGIIADEHFEKLLSEFNVIVLPNTACLSKTQADRLREYVEEGGGLVATYETSLYDEWGNKRDDFLLNDLFGVSYIGKTEHVDQTKQLIRFGLVNFIEPRGEHPVLKDIDREMPLQHIGQQIRVESKSATPLGYIVQPCLKGSVAPTPGVCTKDPTILINEFGKGRVVYFANRLDAVSIEYYLPRFRALLANAVKWAAKDEYPLQVEAPGFVETTILTQPEKKRFIAHLVNHNPTDDLFNIHNIKVRIKIPEDFKVDRVYLAPDYEKLPYESKENWIEVVVPELEIHRMVIMESKA